MTGDEAWPLRRLLTEVVGSGPKTADDMTREQAAAACRRILDGRPDRATLGAFLLANRWKRNTPAELAAFLDVVCESSVRTAAPSVDPVDCGANYDGKTRTAVLGVAAGVVAAAAGTPVVVHSADRVPASRGVAYRHVLDELGVATELDPGDSAAMVDDAGFGFYYQPRFNPAVHDLLPRREELGVRTFLNTVETLANPADADVHVGSFFHLSFARKVIETLERSETRRVPRVVMVQGQEGYDDVRPGTTRVAERRDGEREKREVDTADLGLDATAEDLEVADVATDSAAITREVVRGEREDAFADAVAVDAGVRIYARDDAPSLAAAVDRARGAIADGSAAAVLAGLRERWPSG